MWPHNRGQLDIARMWPHSRGQLEALMALVIRAFIVVAGNHAAISWANKANMAKLTNG